MTPKRTPVKHVSNGANGASSSAAAIHDDVEPKLLSDAGLRLLGARFLTRLVWAVTPISWALLLLVAHRYLSLPQKERSLSRIIGHWPWLRKFLFYYSIFEVPFSIYLAYLTRKASKRRPAPRVDRNTLRTLLIHCLEVGLPYHPQDGRHHLVAGVDGGRLRSTAEGKLPERALATAFEHRQITAESAQLSRQRLMSWFRTGKLEDLRRDNVREWLAWAFLGRELADLEGNAEMEELVEESLALLERRLQIAFPEGYAKGAQSIRLTLDPLRAKHRPFGYYVVCNGITAATILYLTTFRGYRREVHGACEFLVRPPSKSFQQNGVDGEQPLPVLFLHGLGIGLGQYGVFLSRHLARHEAGSVVMIQPHISAWILSPRFIDSPSEQQQVESIRAVLRSNGFGQCTILSHSNGTMLHGWLLRALPEICKRNVLVDCVSLRMHEGALCRNFLYSKPVNYIAELLKYFVSQEVGIAHTICRRFQWPSMALWVPELPSIEASDLHFIFAEKDVLVDVDACVEHLELDEGVSKECITVMEGYQHGQNLFLDGEGMKIVCRHIGLGR